MSDGKEVKQGTLTWPQEISVTCTGGDALPSGSTVVLASDHDRVVAELKAREAAAYKVYQEMSATIGHDKNTIAELRAEVEALRANNMELGLRSVDHHETIACQARVIEKLKTQRSILVSFAHCGDILTDETLERMNEELAAIENGKAEG